MPMLTHRLLRGTLLLAATSVLTATAQEGGQPDGSARSWFGDISVGWAFPQSDASDLLDDDWKISSGVPFWPGDWANGTQAELAYVRFDLSGAAIDAINTDPQNPGQVDDGGVQTWPLVLNGTWGPGGPGNGFHLYGARAWADAALNQTGVVYHPRSCDPWHSWSCVPGGVGLDSVVAGTESATDVGWNLALIHDFPAGDGKVMLEPRYWYITTDSDDLQYVPVTMGYQW
jgi:hypothetical protein